MKSELEEITWHYPTPVQNARIVVHGIPFVCPDRVASQESVRAALDEFSALIVELVQYRHVDRG